MEKGSLRGQRWKNEERGAAKGKGEKAGEHCPKASRDRRWLRAPVEGLHMNPRVSQVSPVGSGPVMSWQLGLLIHRDLSCFFLSHADLPLAEFPSVWERQHPFLKEHVLQNNNFHGPPITIPLVH